MFTAAVNHIVTGQGTPAHAIKNMFVLVGFFSIGPGRYSVDQVIAERRGRAVSMVMMGLGAMALLLWLMASFTQFIDLTDVDLVGAELEGVEMWKTVLDGARIAREALRHLEPHLSAQQLAALVPYAREDLPPAR